MRLRQAGIRLPILLHGGNLVDSALVEAVVSFRLVATIHDWRSVEAFTRSPWPVELFVKINVGLDRFGFVEGELSELADRLRHAPHCRLGGVYSHLDVPRQPGQVPYPRWQFQRLGTAIRTLEASGLPVPLRMAASSRVLLRTRDMALNAVDPGHLIFGLDSGDGAAVELETRPALVGFETRIVQLRTATVSPFPGLGPVAEPAGRRIAIVPLGFADGFARSHAGEVLVRGRRAPILRRHSAEHSRVDFTAIHEVEVGDSVTIIGRQGSKEVGIGAVVRHQGLAREVEVTMGIPGAIPRLHRTMPGTPAGLAHEGEV